MQKLAKKTKRQNSLAKYCKKHHNRFQYKPIKEYWKLLEKEHRKHNSFTKYCNKFFFIEQEMNIYIKIGGKRAQKTQLLC